MEGIKFVLSFKKYVLSLNRQNKLFDRSVLAGNKYVLLITSVKSYYF